MCTSIDSVWQAEVADTAQSPHLIVMIMILMMITFDDDDEDI